MCRSSKKASTHDDEILYADDCLQENLSCYSMLLKNKNRLVNVLNQLDTLITLHQRKLEKLQNIKKSCLEKMFV